MSDSPTVVPNGAAELRRAFDGSFAEPPAAGRATVEDLLDIQVAGSAWALRLGDISGILPMGVLTPIPTSEPALAGVVGLKGAVVPVYDLGRLLGSGAGAGPRWLALAGPPVVAFAFDGLGGFMRLSPEAIVPVTPSVAAPGQARKVAGFAGRQIPVVPVPSLLEALARRVRVPVRDKE